MRRQRAVLQPARHIQPPDAVRMHRERLIPGDCLVSCRTLRRRVVRRLVLREIWYVVAGPAPVRPIPPHELLAIAPRRSVRFRRCTVVEDAPIGWPGVPPPMAILAV